MFRGPIANAWLAALGAGAVVFVAVRAGQPLLLLLVLVALPVLAAIARRPQRGVLLLLALVPFDGLLEIVHLPGAVAAWKEALTGFTLVAAFRKRRSAVRPLPSWTAPLVAFLAVALVMAGVSGGYRGLLGFKIYGFYVLVAIALWLRPFSTRDRDRVVTILMVDGFICSVYGLVQQALGHERLHAMGYEYNKVIRFSGHFMRSWSTFVEPFNFAYFVMIAVIVGLAVSLSDTARLRNRLFLYGLPIFLAGMATSVVRGSWLGLGMAIVYLAITRYRVLTVLVPLGLFGLLLLPSSASHSAFSSSSSEARATGWRANLTTVVQHPIGLGTGATGAAGAKANKAEDFSSGPNYQPDNWYMKLLLELGPIGLLLYVKIIGGWLQESRRARSLARNGPDEALALGVTAMIVAACVVSFNATYYEIFPVDTVTWVLIGTVTAMGDRLARRRSDPVLEVRVP